MHICRRITAASLLPAIIGLLLMVGGFSAYSQADALSQEDIAGAIRSDDISIPTPAEFMAALNKFSKPDWKSKFRAPILSTYPRAQAALNLGTLVADGYIAVEAQDSRQVRNIGKDVIALAKSLGIQDSIINRGKSLTDFAVDLQWEALKEELEATQNEAKQALQDTGDPSLVTLVTVGAWYRGADVITALIAQKYTADSAKMLRQPAIALYLKQQMNALPDKVKEDPAVKLAHVKIFEVEKALSFPRETVPTQEEIANLNKILSSVVRDIARKQQ